MEVSGSRDIPSQCFPESNKTIVNNKTSYAQITQKEVCPTRECAIVLDAVDGLTNRDYALAIGKIIGPQNMTHISRISLRRVCIYFISPKIAETIVNTYKRVTINNNTLEIRPLVSKTKRIIISNAHPVIPDSTIEAKLRERNITLKSSIIKIRSGIHEEGYTHLLSFRRHVYIDQDDINKLPEHLKIEHNSVTYWIYFSTEKLTCFLCKDEGHLAKYCKNYETSTQTNTITESQLTIDTESGNKAESTLTQEQNRSGIDVLPLNCQPSTEFKIPDIYSTKRALSNSTTTEAPSDHASIASNDNNKNTSTATVSKKIKKSLSQPMKRMKITKEENYTQVDMHLKSAETYFKENKAELSIDFENITCFLKDSFGNTDLHMTAAKYTNNIPTLIDSLRKVYGHIEQKSLKSRITRIIKKLDSSPTTSINNSASEDFSSTEE